MRVPRFLLFAGVLTLALGGCLRNGDNGPVAPQNPSLAPSQDGNVVLRGDVGDFVWCDLNDNGLQDDGPASGVNGVDIVIECIRVLDGSLWTMTFTTSNDPVTGLPGWYNFNSVPAGSCMAYVDPATIPAGKVLGDHPCGGPIEFYIGVGPTGNNNKNIDFCLVDDAPPVLGQIGDFVWCDLNDDGVQDSGEPGIAGIVVDLSCADGTNLTTVTDAAGQYLFTDIADGVACTVTLDPASFPADKSPGSHCPTTLTVTLGEGEINLDQDFCFVENPPVPGQIGDFVWCDVNDDGVQDFGEPGIAGIVVDLSCADGSSATTVTDANGYYLFTDVAPGVACTVSLDPVSFPADKSPGSHCPTTLTVTLGEGEINLDQDFCFVENPPVIECCEDGKRPDALTFTYVAQDCSYSDNSQDPAKTSCADYGVLPNTAYIMVTDRSQLGQRNQKVFFEGTVNLGENFTMSSAFAGAAKIPGDTRIWVLDAQGGNIVQFARLHTSCSEPLISGEQYGAHVLVSCE